MIWHASNDSFMSLCHWTFTLMSISQGRLCHDIIAFSSFHNFVLLIIKRQLLQFIKHLFFLIEPLLFIIFFAMGKQEMECWTGFAFCVNVNNIFWFITLAIIKFSIVKHGTELDAQIISLLSDQYGYFKLDSFVIIYFLLFLFMSIAAFCFCFKNKTLRALVVMLFFLTLIVLFMENILTSINTHKMKGSVEKTMQKEIDDLKEDRLMAYLHKKYCCCDIYDTVGGNCTLNFPQTTKCFMGSLNYTTGCFDPMWKDFESMKNSQDSSTFACVFLPIVSSVFSFFPYLTFLSQN